MKKLTHLTLIQSQNLINPIEPHILENILIKINETNIYLNICIFPKCLNFLKKQSLGNPFELTKSKLLLAHISNDPIKQKIKKYQ